MAHARLGKNDLLRQALDSEDLAQDALVQLIQHVERFRGTTWREFFAFVISILAQRKTDLARFHTREKRTVDRVELANREGDRSPAAPSVIVSHGEDRDRLRALVGGLPESLRWALELRLDGMGYDEIGAAAEISTANARQRVSRALGILKQRWPVD
jgi:RNA polymerase sigma factor (sigma-70 family)